MVAEIQAAAARLGLSDGTLLALARETAHDATLLSLYHLTAQDAETLLRLLAWITFEDARLLAKRHTSLESIAA